MSKKNKKFRKIAPTNKKKKGGTGPGNISRQYVFQRAVNLHQAGRLSEAEVLYREILLADPDNPDVLYSLGMLAHQVEQPDIAGKLIGRALQIRPDYVEACINLGNILYEQGKHDEAIANFRRAIILKPNFPMLHNNLGNALRAKGLFVEAVLSFRQALKLEPDYAPAHYNLGNVLLDEGKLEEAAASFHQAINLKPGYAEAHNNLGNILSDQGRLDDAASCFRRALALKPDFAEAHNNLGNTLTDQGLLAEAIASYQQAISLKPEFAEAHYNLGFTYRHSGMTEDAISSYRKAISLKPDYAKAYKGLSAIVKFTELTDEVHAMENLYAGELSDTERIDLGFALGKVFEDLKDYDRAFRYILEANRLKRRSIDYSIQKDSDLFEKIKKTFSPGFFASHDDSGTEDDTPIFILGMPRSGTTLVEQILASHPQVFGAGELTVLQELVSSTCPGGEAAQYPECLPDLDADALRRMGSDYLKGIRVYAEDAPHITDKMPHNFLHVGLIRTILPRARVIHCTRNPMDTCLSIFKNDFAGTHNYAYDMVELGRYYTLYQDLMAYWEESLPGFMYSLRYEDMIADQRKQTEDLLAFCGLPWDDACLAFYRTRRRVSTASLAQVRQPIYKDSVELWKRYEKQLEPLRKAIYG